MTEEEVKRANFSILTKSFLAPVKSPKFDFTPMWDDLSDDMRLLAYAGLVEVAVSSGIWPTEFKGMVPDDVKSVAERYAYGDSGSRPSSHGDALLELFCKQSPDEFVPLKSRLLSDAAFNDAVAFTVRLLRDQDVVEFSRNNFWILSRSDWSYRDERAYVDSNAYSPEQSQIAGFDRIVVAFSQLAKSLLSDDSVAPSMKVAITSNVWRMFRWLDGTAASRITNLIVDLLADGFRAALQEQDGPHGKGPFLSRWHISQVDTLRSAASFVHFAQTTERIDLLQMIQDDRKASLS